MSRFYFGDVVFGLAVVLVLGWWFLTAMRAHGEEMYQQGKCDAYCDPYSARVKENKCQCGDGELLELD